MGTNITKTDFGFRANFTAMASPCEVLINSTDLSLAKHISEIALVEALRIEHKFSRYRKDNIIFKINNANGNPIDLDAETTQLIDYADNCFKLSEGLFDITAGILNKAWDFKEHTVDQHKIERLLPFVGWQKNTWKAPTLTIKKHMQIDLGGIAKEYAVDSTLIKITNDFDTPVLINFGGDLVANKSPDKSTGWKVAIENSNLKKVINLSQGALCTSGNHNRYVIHKGKKLSHIINPKTGWPEPSSPIYATVHAKTCSEAGFLSTTAMLLNDQAEDFLKKQNIGYEIEY